MLLSVSASPRRSPNVPVDVEALPVAGQGIHHPEAAGELQALLAEFKALSPDIGGNVANTITGTILNGPVLMGRDFGDITIGSPDTQPRA